jgi:hypothetical protein
VGDTFYSTLKEQVDVVVEEDPVIDERFVVADEHARTLDKGLSVPVILEKGGSVEAPHHDVMKRSGTVEPGLTGHMDSGTTGRKELSTIYATEDVRYLRIGPGHGPPRPFQKQVFIWMVVSGTMA